MTKVRTPTTPACIPGGNSLTSVSVDGVTITGDGTPVNPLVAADQHYRGVYASLVALQTALPTGNPGDYADVDAGVGTDIQRYIWDDDDGEWIQGGGGGSASLISFTPASGIAATNVQSAIVEAKTDAQAYTDTAAAAVVENQIVDGVTTKAPSQNAVYDALNTITDVSVTAATVLDDNAFGKVHICTGTSADYNLTLPTPSAANAGKSFVVKGDPALTKVVTCVGTIDGESNRAIGAYGMFVLKVNAAGTSYQLITEVGSWIPWTPTWGGFSSAPTVLARYFRVGKKYDFWIRLVSAGTSGGGAGTTLTFTVQFNVSTLNFQQGLITVVHNSGTTALTPGKFITRITGSNVIDCYINSQNGGWVASGAKYIELSGTLELA